MTTNDSSGGGSNRVHPAPPAGQQGSTLAAESAEWLLVTLSSIGDGVITADKQGRIMFLNPVAQALTGWTQEQAVGAPLDRVFDIVNDETRQKVVNPALRALAEGVIVGLANHTILISKDGTERPIDDSAAPIRNAAGETAGAVLVFRDISERSRQERLVKDSREYAENILETLRHPFLVLDKDLRVASANRSFYQHFHAEPSETEGRLIYDLGNGQWDIPRLRELLEQVLPENHALEDFEVRHQFPGIGLRVVALNARRIRRLGNHSELILLVMEDITDRQRDQILLAAQRQILELAAGGAALRDVLGLVVRSARQHAGESTRAAMFTVDPDGACLRFAAAAGLSEAYTSAVDKFEIGPSSPSCGVAAFTGQTVIVGDVTMDPRWAPFLDLAREHKIRACWSEPMRKPSGEVLGTLAIYHSTPREPGPSDLDGIRLLSRTAAVLIERDREQRQRRHTEDSLRESEVRFRRLFETAKDGIIILDANTGRITDVNAFMCALMGLEPRDILGKELHEIGMFTDIEANKDAFRELQRTGYLRHEHLPVQNRRGERVEVEFIANVYGEGNKLVAQCNVRDISERSRLEKLITKQSEILAAQSRSKDEFLAMLSHELRNPLAPIRSAVHLLRLEERGGGNPIQQQAREIIERQVANLTKMVSDLSEVSRVASGRIRLELVPMDLKQIVQHALQSVAPLLEQRKHSVSVSLCAEAVWSLADPTRLEEVLVNLLNNAAKYTPDGGRIGVVCEQCLVGEQRLALLRISDNGVGIDQELLPRIFDLFTQADRSLARSAGGLGIGLALAHRLVTLHGGTIEGHSEGPGNGSAFTLRLPLIPAPATAPASSAQQLRADAPMPGGPGRMKDDGSAVRVLVVDDNVDLVTMLAGTLRHKGYQVQSAYTGPDGLKIAQNWRPDIVLLDIGLPGLDGYEVARRLRADEAPDGARGDDRVGTGGKPGRMKLIAITGYGQDADIALAGEAGFDGHMVKPCDFDELERMMVASAAGA